MPTERGAAQLDHIVPRSRGGTDDASNLRWVHKAINLLKRGMTDEDMFRCVRALSEGPAYRAWLATNPPTGPLPVGDLSSPYRLYDPTGASPR